MSLAHTQVTFRYERLRAAATGIMEAAGTTFLLLIAVRHFEAGPTAKALIAAGGSVGHLISPFVVDRAAKLGWPVAQAASRVSFMGATALLLAVFAPGLPLFVLGSVIATTCASAAIPLMIQVYQTNYPPMERGRLFSKAMVVRIGMAALANELGGRLLAVHLEYFRALLLFFAAAFAFGAWCQSRVPSEPLTVTAGTHPLRAVRYAREDRLFRLTLISWMFMGMGNLMMFPLRVEYLANERYGLKLDVTMVALFVGVIPNMARLVCSPVWGWLFDRMNFFTLRAVLNIGFALGILSFFVSNSYAGLALGAVIFGVSNAGGDVAWSLWVTKFAPPERVADYMSVHTFFTGIRGVAAPLIAFHLVGTMGMTNMAWMCTALIAVSVVMLGTEVPLGRKAKAATPTTEEISE
ncbi:MAG: MFS transporter [Verrucomicrobia bacterium]|nr:MFS transporter [Verrucomicrobiota bacterium]